MEWLPFQKTLHTSAWLYAGGGMKLGKNNIIIISFGNNKKCFWWNSKVDYSYYISLMLLFYRETPQKLELMGILNLEIDWRLKQENNGSTAWSYSKT